MATIADGYHNGQVSCEVSLKFSLVSNLEEAHAGNFLALIIIVGHLELFVPLQFYALQL